MTDDLVTHNKYGIFPYGNRIVIQWPPCGSISHDDALNLAAWIVAVTGKEERFRRILEAIEKEQDS